MRGICFLLALTILSTLSFGQQNVGIGTTTPNSSAILELSSTNKGLLLPRMQATQRLAITPVNGLLVYDLDSSSLFIYESAAWKRIRSISNLGSLIAGSNAGDMIQWNGSAWVILPNPVKYTLNITKSGYGDVTSSVAGVYCGSDCSEQYNNGTVITLTATPGPGATFAGWSGGVCSGTGSCIVTMSANRNVTATFTYPLTVAKTGSGSGTVTSVPAGISCGGTCGGNYNSGQVISLFASPDANSTFTGWSGACSGTGACNVTMDDVKNVTAFFTKTQYLLAVSKTGTGDGAISSSPSGISCDPSCFTMYDAGTTVTLTATADGSSAFAGWSGACSGTGSCVVTMDAIKNVKATFTRLQYTVGVTKTGSGSVISSPSGIVCSPACSDTFDGGTTVILTPVPDAGLSFGEWSGACTGSSVCILTMDGNKSVNARFGYQLNTIVTGGSGGTISSSPAGINCGSTCSYVFNSGTVVTLTQTPAANATFVGWSGGGCSGTGICNLTMNAATSVNAVYTFPLNVTRYNNGGGTVTSSPAGISCPGTCSAAFIAGVVVSLTPTPASGASFAGWTGDCSGTGACNVTMNALRNVEAIFSYPITVTKNASSGGTISSPSGFNCGTSCANETLSFNYNDAVTLTATPASGATFSSWTGCDSPSGNSCVMTANAVKTVQANFAYPVTASVTNATGGTVLSSPAGINCSNTCSFSFSVGSSVSITPTASSGATFSSWSGCDAVVGNTCNLTMNSAKTVVATFTYPLTAAITNSTGGTITSAPAGINCPGTCNTSFTAGSSVTLTATPSSGASFADWTGCDAVVGNACTVTMNAVRNATARFTYPLTVSKSGAGTGTVTSSPGGINCGATCTASYTAGSTVVLTATASGGSSFGGWTNCPSPSGNSCTVPMTAVRNVTATFN